MPKHQPTAAKRARRAAREGAKYTSALRGTRDTVEDDLAVPPSALGIVPVSVSEWTDFHPETEPTVRWGLVEVTANGYLIRETRPGVQPSAPIGVAGGRRWPRVAVPYRDRAGKPRVAELPALVWASQQTCWRWVFAHSGWAVAWPGEIAPGASSLRPGLTLQFEIAQFQSTDSPDSIFGEDYTGGPAAWSTASWCESEEDARELADAFLAWDGGITLQVQVWEHAMIALNELPELCYQRDRELTRPPAPLRLSRQAVTGRPAAPSAQLLTEPEWHTGVPDHARPKYALHVWTESGGWHTHSWHIGRQQAGLAAQALGVGIDGGRYLFGYVSGPRYPRAWDHDWTQDGRSCADLLPEPTFAESQDQEHMQRVMG